MSDYFKEFMTSGRALLLDTKSPRKVVPAARAIKKEHMGVVETDPYKAFVKRVVTEKPKKTEIVKELKRFAEAAEAAL